MSPLEAVHQVARELDEAGVPSPRVDAELLVADVLGVSRSALYVSDRALGEGELARLEGLVARRREREPLAYILGEWGFRRLVLAVDARALVPRPETEVVVERCLEHLRGLEAPRVVDVGTGSGAIALALADEHPGASVVAVDSSEDALALARENVERTGLGARVELRQGDLLAGLEGPFDLVVSNPPYVPPVEFPGLQPEIRLYEPYEAVVGDHVWERVARDAPAVLRAGGHLVLECGDGQAAGVAEGLAALGYEGVLAPRTSPAATEPSRGTVPRGHVRGQTPDVAGGDMVAEHRSANALAEPSNCSLDERQGPKRVGTGVSDGAVAALRAGQLVVLPTDTVYGLCADAYRERHCLRLYAAKRRPEAMPVQLLAADLDTILDAVPEARGRGAVVARALLPGPYTLDPPEPGAALPLAQRVATGDDRHPRAGASAGGARGRTTGSGPSRRRARTCTAGRPGSARGRAARAPRRLRRRRRRGRAPGHAVHGGRPHGPRADRPARGRGSRRRGAQRGY